MTIVMAETRPLQLDPYILDVLMRDLVGHDRSAASFLVYLWLWRQSRGQGRATVAASLQMLARATGLSKSSVQRSVAHLRRRRLVEARRDSPTAAPVYTVAEPWRRQES